LIDPQDEATARTQLALIRERGSADAESTAISRDLAGKLLSRLKPDDRVVLTLLDAEELPIADIAELLGWSQSKVKVRAHRARVSLRRVLAEFL
jgi:RNA polymerase sigma-70 factor (ECF subfamily)